MPKLILHAVLARQELSDKQCLHDVQNALMWGHSRRLAPLPDPAQTSSRELGGTTARQLARRARCALWLLWKAQRVDFLLIPALALGSCKAISHRQTALSLQNMGLSRWRAQRGDRCTCTKREKKPRWRARRGVLFASRQEPACLWKSNQARNYFSTLQSDLPLFLFSLSSSNQVPTDETPA